MNGNELRLRSGYLKSVAIGRVLRLVQIVGVKCVLLVIKRTGLWIISRRCQVMRYHNEQMCPCWVTLLHELNILGDDLAADGTARRTRKLCLLRVIGC